MQCDACPGEFFNTNGSGTCYACPEGARCAGEAAIEPLPGVKHVDVELTWEPQWGMDMMSDEARLELGFM